MKIENINKVKNILKNIEDIDRFIKYLNMGSNVSIISASKNEISSIDDENIIEAISNTLYIEKNKLLKSLETL